MYYLPCLWAERVPAYLCGEKEKEGYGNSKGKNAKTVIYVPEGFPPPERKVIAQKNIAYLRKKPYGIDNSMVFLINPIVYNIISQNKVTEITADHVRLDQRGGICNFPLGKQCADSFAYNLKNQEQKQKILNIFLVGVLHPYPEDWKQHIDTKLHGQIPKMVSAKKHFLDDIAGSQIPEAKVPAIHQAVQAGPYDKEDQQPQNIVGVELFHICLRGSWQKQSTTDHHKNRNTEPKKRIIGIGNQPAEIRHRIFIPALRRGMKHNNAERRKNAKQIIVNHAIVVCLFCQGSLLWKQADSGKNYSL